eukprot:CAMPEP_0119161610 /NCGR_PEP_ID=MMETSP1315-20130426/1533_1 /TAXON_ID=676789 /ORGANISM="Prasinoderma singularis, Strain RCC927" /LENGTH=44 /DNA_ID= /DNA_START= /DNA_END= /DNA_ORIENTATION=
MKDTTGAESAGRPPSHREPVKAGGAALVTVLRQRVVLTAAPTIA